MVGKKLDIGPTGDVVRRRVAELREVRGLSYAELSRRLTEVGRPIPPLGLRRIESGERRVDVDDLVALAWVLGVSPSWLFLPREVGWTTMVEHTAVGKVSSHHVENWLRGDVSWGAPFEKEPGETDEDHRERRLELWRASKPGRTETVEEFEVLVEHAEHYLDGLKRMVAEMEAQGESTEGYQRLIEEAELDLQMERRQLAIARHPRAVRGDHPYAPLVLPSRESPDAP